MSGLGKILIYLGLAIAVIGLILNYTGNVFSWFGHLPGDIRIEKENFSLYFPVVSLILISVVLNLLIYIFKLFIK